MKVSKELQKKISKAVEQELAYCKENNLPSTEGRVFVDWDNEIAYPELGYNSNASVYYTFEELQDFGLQIIF